MNLRDLVELINIAKIKPSREFLILQYCGLFKYKIVFIDLMIASLMYLSCGSIYNNWNMNAFRISKKSSEYPSII